MSNAMIPGAAGGDSEQAGGGAKPDREPSGDAFHHRREGQIPSAEACLRALAQLAGLVALGVLKPAQANSIRASYREILQYHQKSQSREERQGLSNADVLDLVRKDPRILSMLEALLTDEQIAMAMKAVQDGNGGQA